MAIRPAPSTAAACGSRAAATDTGRAVTTMLSGSNDTAVPCSASNTYAAPAPAYTLRPSSARANGRTTPGAVSCVDPRTRNTDPADRSATNASAPDCATTRSCPARPTATFPATSPVDPSTSVT